MGLSHLTLWIQPLDVFKLLQNSIRIALSVDLLEYNKVFVYHRSFCNQVLLFYYDNEIILHTKPSIEFVPISLF